VRHRGRDSPGSAPADLFLLLSFTSAATATPFNSLVRRSEPASLARELTSALAVRRRSTSLRSTFDLSRSFAGWHVKPRDTPRAASISAKARKSLDTAAFLSQKLYFSRHLTRNEKR